MWRIISLLVGYALGCVNFAFIIGKLKNIDIRDHGSGNAGMTNATRVLGGKAGLIVFLLDILKAAAAYWIAARLFGGAWWFTGLSGNVPPFPQGLYAGLGAVLGHCFPFYMGFRGGKGVSSTLGLAVMMDWRIAAVIAMVGVPMLIWKRYISLVALVGSAMLAPLMLLFHWYNPDGFEMAAVLLAITALIWWKHRGNLQRLLNGTERKFLSKKEKGNA